MTPRTRLAARAAIGLFSTCSVLACSEAKPSAERTPTPVKVRAVERTLDANLSRYSGLLEPAVRVDMAFRVGGYVDALGDVVDNGKTRALQAGDFVKKGTLLARIRSADYAQKVATAQAMTEEARSEARLAEAELTRAVKLFESKAISKAELDSKQARADWSKANVDGARARSGEAGVALADTVLRAPLDGVILSRDVEIGALVSPGRPVLTVADVTTVKASFGVPQALVERLSVGSPLQVHVSSDSSSSTPEKLLDARVSRIAPSADTKGRVFSVEAELPNPSGALRPGSVVSVHVPNSTLEAAALSVPLSAVVRAPRDPRGFSVFVLDGEGVRARARLQTVKLGEVLGNAVTVNDGLRIGQRVVTVGATLIQDGSDTVVIP